MNRERKKRKEQYRRGYFQKNKVVSARVEVQNVLSSRFIIGVLSHQQFDNVT